MVRCFWWTAGAFFSPSIEDGRCNVVCAAASEAAIGEVLLFCICRFTQHALDGFLAQMGVLALESRFSVVEGLDRHVLAGSLFSGTGEQASGRVDVPGKDIQQRVTGWGVLCRQDGTPGHCRTGQAARCTQVGGL